jgi:hypothetical protein
MKIRCPPKYMKISIGELLEALLLGHFWSTKGTAYSLTLAFELAR